MNRGILYASKGNCDSSIVSGEKTAYKDRTRKKFRKISRIPVPGCSECRPMKSGYPGLVYCISQEDHCSWRGNGFG